MYVLDTFLTTSELTNTDFMTPSTSDEHNIELNSLNNVTVHNNQTNISDNYEFVEPIATIEDLQKYIDSSNYNQNCLLNNLTKTVFYFFI